MKIKTRKDSGKTEKDFYHEIIKKFENRLKKAEKNSISDDLHRSLELAKEFEKKDAIKSTKELIKWKKFLARSSVVKQIHADIVKFINLIQQEYKGELKYSRKDRYPLKWMLNDKRINEALNRRPLVIKFLNYVFNLNRYVKSDDIKNMGEEYGEFIKRPKRKITYAVFQTDSEFFELAAKKLNCSEIYLKKLIQFFHKKKIYQRLGKAG